MFANPRTLPGLILSLVWLPSSALADRLEDLEVPEHNQSGWADIVRRNFYYGQGYTEVVWVCGEHFGINTEARANLQAALDLYEGLPGVDLNFVIGEYNLTHVDWDDVVKPPNTIYVDFDDIGPGYAAWGGAEGTCSNPHIPGVVRRCSRGELRPSSTFYSDAFNNPNTASSANGDRIPSVALFAHELGHILGLDHPSDATENIETIKLLGEAAPTRKFGYNAHSERTGVYTARTLAALTVLYPPLNPDPNLEIDDLSVNDLFVTADTSDPANPTMRLYSPDKRAWQDGGLVPNPAADALQTFALRWNTNMDQYEACDDPGTQPNFVVQFSELSTNTNSKNFDVRIRVSRGPHFVFGSPIYTEVARRVGLQTYRARTKFRQINWSTEVEIDSSDVNILDPAHTYAERQLIVDVDPDDDVPERDESNNSYAVKICLNPEGQTCGICDQATPVPRWRPLGPPPM